MARNSHTQITESNEQVYSDVDLSEFDSDSDSDNSIELNVAYKIHSTQSGSLMRLEEFFNDPKMINPTRDPSTNIVDRMHGKCYNVPLRKMEKLFNCINDCRKDGIRLMLAERQKNACGIMLDFDIMQDRTTSQFTDKMFDKLVRGVFSVLMEIINMGDPTVYVGITRRPKVVYKKSNECYKDGFHMLIPGIKVTRGVKLLLISKLIEGDLISEILSDIEPADITIKGQKYNRNDFLDRHSAYVPTFLIGSATKKGNQPYTLSHVFKVDVEGSKKSIYVTTDVNMIASNDINICHEFALNFERPNGVIKMHEYDASDAFINEIQKLEEVKQHADEDITRNFGELSMNALHDGNIKEIRDLLDVLDVSRYEDYGKWRNVLCALANTSPSYKDLGEYFSRKSDKFSMVDFDRIWIGITSRTVSSRAPLTIASIHYWARTDNPDRYKKIREKSVYTILYNMVYEGYREGILNHSDVSVLCHALLKHKFVVDVPPGERKYVWYEFMLDNDDYCDGELYKWHQWKTVPSSLSNYISRILPKLFKTVFNRVKKNYKESSGEIAKYYSKVLRNFKATTRRLGDRNFKKNVILEAEDIFVKRGFASKLDTDPLIRGVSNGVLKLSLERSLGPVLIQGRHTHLVSKFTPVPYIAFNPRDPITKKILITLRNLFPDDEPDSFNFTMMYLASTIDGLPAESMFMISSGGGSNGKSFLMELHRCTIGETYGVKLPLTYLICKSAHADNATPAVMMLQYASLATYSESNKHEILNAARIKEVTGMETIAGRRLRQDMINFKPHAMHWMCSNYDLDVSGGVGDYGLWRRIEYNPFKMKFINPNVHKYDPDDKYTRIGDDNMIKKWPSDPEIMGRYLGIMTWYHWHLYRKHDGKVKEVPHPHINFETEKYKRRQDVITSFLAQRLVITDDPEAQYDIVKEIQKYIKWYALNYEKIPSKGLTETFQNSQIGKHITKTKRGLFLTGHRFLDNDEQLSVGETYAMKNVFNIAAPDDNFGIEVETSEQYYTRICGEYEKISHIFDGTAKFDIDIDILNNVIDKSNELEYNNAPGLELNGDILPCGIVIESAKSPVRFTQISQSQSSDLEGILPDYGDIVVSKNKQKK